MNFTFKKIKFSEIQKTVINNLKEYNSLIDDFLEDRILNSNHYSIELNGDNCGYFSIHMEKTLIQFFLKPQYRKFAQIVFSQVKLFENLEKALVPTCDMFFLNTCFCFSTQITKQAYFFTDTKTNQLSNEYKLELKKSEPKDVEIIKTENKDFYKEFIVMSKKGLLYTVYDAEKVVGFAPFSIHPIRKACVSIGVYVLKEKRQKGYGKNILRTSRNLAYKKGLEVTAGCYFYNHNSKKTLESAGFYASTILLNIKF